MRIFALSRAIENQSYLIVDNRVGTDDGVTLCGTSTIIDPHGAILAGLLFFPILGNLRPDLVFATEPEAARRR